MTEGGSAAPPDRLEVPAALEGERVDRAVATLTGMARADIARLCERDAVLVGDRAVGKSHRLVAGDVITITEQPIVAGPPGAENIPIDVVYEDAEVIVVAKPAGLVVHPGAGHPGGTLVNALLARYPELTGVGGADRPGIVHRLDRDTSGLMVVARTPYAYDALVAALAERSVTRHYDALVWGHPKSPRGTVDAPIGRSIARRTRMAVRQGGREARTRYEVVDDWNEPVVSRLRCVLETGRTHQIRVHLSAIGHPVVGDATYGGARDGVSLGRPFLHAGALAFAQPRTGEPLSFEQPLPPELVAVLDRLGAPAGRSHS